MKAVLGFVVGAFFALIAADLLFGAPTRMQTTSDAFKADVYYVVQPQRFDWFRKDGPNDWGGHTLDGRRISAVYVSHDRGNFRTDWVAGPECDPPHKCDDHGFLIASPAAKRKVATSCPNANPLYVEHYGRCPK